MLAILLAAGAILVSAPERVTRVVDMEVAISSDGALAFASNRSGEFDIYTLAPDGETLRRVTHGGGKDTPAWSPDGEQIAYSSEAVGNADIFVVARGGGHARRITFNPYNDIHPFWSSDGKQIVFTRYTPDEADSDDGRLDVLVMNADGSGEKLLVKGGSYGSLSPDGAKLLYWRYFDGNADIVIADVAGKLTKRLTNDSAFEGWPAWSPDGAHIAFAREEDDSSDIFVFDIASGETHQLTSGGGRKTSPKWSPDGQAIYFDGTVNGVQGIWRVDLQIRSESKTQ